MDKIYWDRDWEMRLVEPDDLSDLAEHLRSELGVASDYYTAVPPDPTPRQLAAIRRRLDKLYRMRMT